jgi:hypothetical protein
MRKLFSFISAAAAAAVLALLCMVAAMGGVNAAPSMLVDSNLERWSSLNSTYIGTTCSIYLCGDAGNDQQKCFDYQCCWQTQVNWGFNYNGDGVYEPTSICNISAADRDRLSADHSGRVSAAGWLLESPSTDGGRALVLCSSWLLASTAAATSQCEL